MLLQGLLIWRCQVWEYQRPHSSLNYLTFHDDIPAWSGRGYPLQRSAKGKMAPTSVRHKKTLYDVMTNEQDRGPGILVIYCCSSHHSIGGNSFIWVHHPRIILPMYSPSQLLTYPGLMYESPHILLMYCWYMLLRQLCVIYAGITIDARTGHTLVGLH